jgi:hypothetical protein
MNNINTTTNKTLYDTCANQKATTNGSIFDYYTDNSMFINKNKCNDFTPPFISHTLSNKNIDLENSLKGITRSNSLCANAKYIPTDSNLIERLDTVVQKQENKHCTNDYKILPNGYIKN